ncbi:gluconokinase [Cellulomonas soli]|uniref:gluconokinase n=1 Tax=Cellulomonas soli TaxID=931535 RepID=UPI003F85631B
MSRQDTTPAPGVHVVVMGVSGSGKSTVAGLLAERLSLPFGEGDEFHGERNRALMASGVPLTDEDRAPWLVAVRDWMSEQVATGSVVACSALRRAYRDVLRGATGEVLFLEVDVPAQVLRTRMAARTEHFMPVSLLDSQLATLEHLAPDEPGLRVDGAAPLPQVVDACLAGLRAQRGAAGGTPLPLA